MRCKIEYDDFLTQIYDYSPYFGKERCEKDFATPFYLEALKNVNGKILEFVSCTGLLTIPLARANYKLDSVDISPYMHEYIRRKLEKEERYVGENISLHCCDVFDYCCEEQYQAIVMPDSFLLALADKQKQVDLLKMSNLFLQDNGRI